jgi:hypothetical protein
MIAGRILSVSFFYSLLKRHLISCRCNGMKGGKIPSWPDILTSPILSIQHSGLPVPIIEDAD